MYEVQGKRMIEVGVKVMAVNKDSFTIDSDIALPRRSCLMHVLWVTSVNCGKTQSLTNQFWLVRVFLSYYLWDSDFGSGTSLQGTKLRMSEELRPYFKS